MKMIESAGKSNGYLDFTGLSKDKFPVLFQFIARLEEAGLQQDEIRNLRGGNLAMFF